MRATPLIQEFKRLCHGSKQSVQSGQSLDDFDRYLHVDRPIDRAVRKAMDDIIKQGGGIVFCGEGIPLALIRIPSPKRNAPASHTGRKET